VKRKCCGALEGRQGAVFQGEGGYIRVHNNHVGEEKGARKMGAL